MMEILKDIEKLTDKIKQERDELQVQLHLGGMDAKAEWVKAEEKWHEFAGKAEQIKDDTVETTEELVSSIKIVGEEISEAYRRIVERIQAK
ncbi:MAG: hypothetical protein ACU84J_10660 [Gammaproteobacteria bacterium]